MGAPMNDDGRWTGSGGAVRIHMGDIPDPNKNPQISWMRTPGTTFFAMSQRWRWWVR